MSDLISYVKAFNLNSWAKFSIKAKISCIILNETFEESELFVFVVIKMSVRFARDKAKKNIKSSVFDQHILLFSNLLQVCKTTG